MSVLKKIDKTWVILIDGTTFVYRAYFAISGHLATTKGFPTKAVFGVTQMILKILKEWDPEYIIWFADEKEPTFRHMVYENYKATRPRMPDELKVQLPYIKEIIQALGIPVVSFPGYEADDLIASFVKKVIEPLKKKAIIVAGDKDLYSIISEEICLYDPVRENFLDKEDFIKRFGFEPCIFPEFRALTGDKSDNIPGVPGIGEKTAKDLILKFGSLDQIYANVSKISPLKLRESLIKHKDQVYSNLKLLLLNHQAPLPSENLEFYKRKPIDKEVLKRLFKELEFRKFMSELDLSGSFEIPKIEERFPFEKINKVEEVPFLAINYYKKINSLFSSLQPVELLATFRKDKVYKLEPESFKKVKNFCKKFVLYDYKTFIKEVGIIFDVPPLDVKLACYLFNPSLKSYDLSFIFQEYLDFSLNSLKGSQQEIEAAKTCGLFLLGEKFSEELKTRSLEEWFYKVEVPLARVLFEMEKVGIKIDVEYVRNLNQEYREKLKALEEELFKLAGKRFNPRSSREVAEILFEKFNLPKLKKTPKSSLPSTDAEVLEELAPLHPFARLLLQYRTLYKIKSTYLEAFLKYVKTTTYRLHTEFSQTGTATGRLSSQNPNLQNIPIKGEEGLAIRRSFIAEDNHLLCSLDYSQIELRILAHFSEDENLIKAFERGEDIHTFTACEVFGVTPDKVTPEMRRVSKAINFGIAYGMGAYGLSKELKISLKEAEAIIERYFKRYPKVKIYIEKMIKFVKENGYVTTLSGRKRYIPEVFSSDKAIRDLGFRMAVNTPIQGSASDLIKCAMVALFYELEKRRLKTKILLQIHDELLLEVPENEVEIIKHIAPKLMENPFQYLSLNLNLKVPIKVNLAFGKTWADCKN